MSSVKAAYEAWKSTCTVPDHPKRCPDCQHKVKLFHTPQNYAAFMCTNIGKCCWPIDAPDVESYVGESDSLKFFKYILIKDRKKEKKRKRKERENSRDRLENEDTFGHLNLRDFIIPAMMSPIARTPRREAPPPSPIREVNHKIIRQTEIDIEQAKISMTNREGTEVISETPEAELKIGQNVPDAPEMIGKVPAEEVDPFLRPTSPVQSLPPPTPFHFPSLLSPLPNTPRRGEPRTPIYPSIGTPSYHGGMNEPHTPKYHLLDDLKLTSDESDLSDFEKTPRANDSERFTYTLSPRFPVGSPSVDKRSKFVNQTASSVDKMSNVKVLLTRDKSSSEWNVSTAKSSNDTPESEIDGIRLPVPTRQTPIQGGNKLDKVVLNLKKSAGSNQWNVNSTANSGSAFPDDKRIKESPQRQGRKSKTVKQRKIHIPSSPPSVSKNEKSPNQEDSAKTLSPKLVTAAEKPEVSTATKPVSCELISFKEVAKTNSGSTNESLLEVSPRSPVYERGQNLLNNCPNTSTDRGDSTSSILSVKKALNFPSPRPLIRTSLPPSPATSQTSPRTNVSGADTSVPTRSNANLWETGMFNSKTNTGSINLKVLDVSPLNRPSESKQLKVLLPLKSQSEENSPEKSIELSTKASIKTFSRKDRGSVKKPSFKVLPSLSNQITMNTGINVSIAIPDLSTDLAQNENSCRNVVDTVVDKLSNIMIKYVQENEDPEIGHFRTLMKSVSSRRSDFVDVVKQVQTSVDLFKKESSVGKATIHVGRGNKNIDLPSEDSLLDVSQPNKSSVQIMMTSCSDGIEASELKRPLTPPPESNFSTPKRGRPRKAPSRCYLPCGNNLDEDEASLPQMYGENWDLPLGHDFVSPPLSDQSPQKMILPSVVVGHNLAELTQTFFDHLGILMRSFVFPPEYEGLGIDPYIAMMLSFRQDPAFSRIDFGSMLHLYASMRPSADAVQRMYHQHREEQYQLLSGARDFHTEIPSNHVTQGVENSAPDPGQRIYRQHREEHHLLSGAHDFPPVTLSNHVEQEVKTSASERQNVDKTYAELQTVRVGVGIDANEVLRHHNRHENESASNNNLLTKESSKSVSPSARRVFKQEVILPSTPSFPDWVVIQSVRPGPSSVSEVASFLPPSGKIGRGNLNICVQYEKSFIGPIYVETKSELKLVKAVIEQKIGELESKSTTGSKIYFALSTDAVVARSRLQPDVLEYLDRSFTQKGLKMNILGRPKHNYPKRSSVISLRPSGELVYPGESADKPKDIPVRLIKREVQPPPALASSEVMPSRLERDVFSYAPLPQAEKVVKNKPVILLPSATEVAEQILQASIREMQKSTEQSSKEGDEINVVSPFKVVEKSSLSKFANLQPEASASSANENSSNTVKENNKQASMETMQKDGSSSKQKTHNEQDLMETSHKDGKMKLVIKKILKRKGEDLPITSNGQAKNVRIEIPATSAPVVKFAKKPRLILAKILPRLDPNPNLKEIPTARTTSSSHIGNPDNKPAHVQVVVVNAVSQQPETNTPAQSSDRAQCQANSDEKTTFIIKNKEKVMTTKQRKSPPKELGNNLASLPAEVLHRDILHKDPVKKSCIDLKEKPSRFLDSNPIEEQKSTNVPESLEVSIDACSSASTLLPPTIDLRNDQATRSVINLRIPFPETKVKSIFDISDFESSSSKKNLLNINHSSSTDKTYTNVGLQPLPDEKAVGHQSEGVKVNHPPNTFAQAQPSMLPLQPLCHVPNQVIASPIVWTLTSEIGSLTSSVVPKVVTISTGGKFSKPISSQVHANTSTVKTTSFSNNPSKTPSTLTNSNVKPKVDLAEPSYPSKKKLRKETTARSFEHCIDPTSGSDFSSMIDLVLKKSKDVDIEKVALTEKKSPNPPQSSASTKKNLTATKKPQATTIQPDVKPEASIATRTSMRRKINSEHQQTTSAVAGSTVTSSAVATEMNLSQVFVRSKLEEKVQDNLLKKRKLEEKLHRKEERRNAKKIFKGFSQDSGGKSILPDIKFSKAVPINGVKRVLKSTGDLVKVDSDKRRRGSQCDSETKFDKRTFISQEERSLMDSLLQVGSAAVQQTAVAAPVVRRAQEVTFSAVNSLIDQFEISHTQDPDMLGMDVPSLDDLL